MPYTTVFCLSAVMCRAEGSDLSLEQAAQGSGEVTIHGSVQKRSWYCTPWYSLVGMVVFNWRLDLNLHDSEFLKPRFPLFIGGLITVEDLDNMVYWKHLRRHEIFSCVSRIVAPFPFFYSPGFVTLWCQCQDLALPTACLLPGPLYASMAALLVLPHPFWHTQWSWHPTEWEPFLNSPLDLMGGRLHLPVHPAYASCRANLHAHTTLTDAPGYWNPRRAWSKIHSGLPSNVDAATSLADQPFRVNTLHVYQDLSWNALNSSSRQKEFLENLESCQKTQGRTQNATAWLRWLDKKSLTKYI